MAMFPLFGVPKTLRRRAKQVEKGVSVIVVNDKADRDDVINRLTMEGFTHQRNGGRDSYYTKPKKFGAGEIAVIVYGLICFVIPAVIYYMLWAAMPNPVVIVRKSETYVETART